MDKIDSTDPVPLLLDDSIRFAKIDMPALSQGLAADGTRTGLRAAPPPLPAAALLRGHEPSREWLAKLAAVGAADPIDPVIEPPRPVDKPLDDWSLEPVRDEPSVEIDLAAIAAPSVAEGSAAVAMPPLPPLPRARASLPPPRRANTQTGIPILAPTLAPPLPPSLPVAVRPALPVQPALPVWPVRIEETERVEPLDLDEVMPNTGYFDRSRMMTLVTKRAMISIGAGVAVILIAYLALRGDGTTSTTAAATQAPALAPPPAIVTPPAPVAAPTPAAVPVAAPELVHVPIVSRPAGATVTLLDNGNAQVIGRTPTEVAVDPARNYDVVVALAKHPTKIAHLDPSSTPQLTVDLNQAAPQPVVAAKPQPVVAAKPQPVVAAKPLAPAQPVRPQHVTTAAPHPVAAAAPVAGRGVLMISSKPPCEIVVDGKSTHLMTPQRSLPLAPGHHQVALLNPQQKIKRTLDIQIDANHPTKVIQDFTKK